MDRYQQRIAVVFKLVVSPGFVPDQYSTGRICHERERPRNELRVRTDLTAAGDSRLVAPTCTRQACEIYDGENYKKDETF
jgi:hypothetical protein